MSGKAKRPCINCGRGVAAHRKQKHCAICRRAATRAKPYPMKDSK